ncbi:MAG: hypothetical protein HYX83_04455 [Chloroflexi bacterium]|nr:hypothetical protein [Chloroflexota bacterium]
MKKWIGVAAVVLAITVAVIAVSVPAFGRNSVNLLASKSTSYDQGDWDDMVSYCHGEGGMMGGGMMGGSYMGLGDEITLTRVAGILGLTYEQLTAELNQGKTIAEIAQAQGVDTSLLVTTILAPESEILQVRVKYGYLTETQAQAILEQSRQWIERAIATTYGATRNTTGGMMGGSTTGGGMMGGGMMGGGMMGGSTTGGSTTGRGMMGW